MWREVIQLLVLIILLPLIFRSPAEPKISPQEAVEAPVVVEVQTAIEPMPVEEALPPRTAAEDTVEDLEPLIGIPGKIEVAALPPLPQEEIDANFLYMRYAMTPKVDGTGDFTWKDLKAAERAHMDLQKFVVGGLDKKFVRTMANLLRGAIAAGLDAGVTSCFRNDYRQSLITRGTHSASHLSFHGGSARGGYGYGRACDVVHVAQKEKERHELNLKLWVWIEQHGKEFGVGLPYGRFDGGHVAPISGAEYSAKYNPLRTWTKYVAALNAPKRKAPPKAKVAKKKPVQVAYAKTQAPD